MIFDETTPIAALTVGDLKELLRELKLDRSSASVKPGQGNGKRYVYGLKGIQSLFNCSHLTAQRYKDTFLKPAVPTRCQTASRATLHSLRSFRALGHWETLSRASASR